MAPSGERLLAVIDLQNAIAAAGLNVDDVIALVCERAGALTQGGASATSSAALLVDGSDLVVRAAARPSPLAPGARIPRAGSVVGRCIDDRAPIRIDAAATDARADAETVARTGAGSILAVPLLYGETAVGALELASTRANAFDDGDLETLRLLAQIVAIALHRAYTYPRPKQDTQHDALTGLGNKRAFDERILAELTRDKRYGHSFSLALLDLDGLESAVDRAGQAAGDAMVREVAAILQKQTRTIDACFRIGPDDFALVMPGTTNAGARVVAERCRAQIADAPACAGAIQPSFGVVQAADESADELTTRARAAVAADRTTRR